MPLAPLEGIIYGPVVSRRLGRSLGVNLMPAGTKVCNMNCSYCQYGWTKGRQRERTRFTGWPAARTIEFAVEARLGEAARRNELIDRITIAGHGEPTLHPAFSEIADRICGARDRFAPAVPVAVLSNSTTSADPDVKEGLMRVDERYMKLDAGDQSMDAPGSDSAAWFTALIDALRALPSIVIQAMFVADEAGRADNASDFHVGLWLAAVKAVRPESVQVYTIDRPPALETLRPVSAGRLREIAERVRQAAIPAEIFPAAGPRVSTLRFTS